MNKNETNTFIDKALIVVQGGSGGDGCCSFRREKFVPRGGPDGGDGGKGGSVYIRANPQLKTLLDFVRKTRFEAGRAEHGKGRKKSGSNGLDSFLDVPCGTMICDGDEVLADLLSPGDEVLVAQGGQGGRGNVHFKNSVRQAPRIAERGEPGVTRELDLRLKIIADVGLIGMPNAGKSTLLSRLTRAHPKIANYPFTTLFPNLGVAMYKNREIILADIPGLIEGSHTGKGLGHEFLKHIERTRILVHMVDPLGFGGKPAKENIKIIQHELKAYSKSLSKKLEMIVINKLDLTEAEEVYNKIKKAYRSKKIYAVSGVSGVGLEKLLAEIVKVVDQVPREKISMDVKPIRISLEPDFKIKKENTDFYVEGGKVEKLIMMTNFDLPDAVARTQYIIKKMGIERALVTRGAVEGDMIHIGGLEFSFEPSIDPGEFATAALQLKKRRKE